MANLTKAAIKNSAIKLLNERPVNKITVKDIVEDCGINRNSFYYHYEDLPSLIEEIIIGEADRMINTYSELHDLDECLDMAISFAIENKRAVFHLHNSSNRELYERYLWRVCEHSVTLYLDTVFAGRTIAEEDRAMLIRYYKCLIFGQIINWLNVGMKTDLKADVHRMCELRMSMAEDLMDKLC